MISFALRQQHTSLQFSDNPKQQEHDVRALFELGGRYPLKSGTEAGDDGKGGNTNRELLTKFAEEFDHTINFAGDAWVAVDRKVIVPKSITKEDVFLASNDDMVGHGTDRIMPTISFEHVKPGLGRIHHAAVHYPTKGATPGSPNYDLNKKCAAGIAFWMAKVARGADLAFVSGDFNMPDRSTDWSLGRNFTSMADELEAWQNTGHGPIDGFCSYDRDGRVKAHRFTVLDDSELKLFSDHFMCRGTWEVRLLEVTA